jgi:hypothetical protein
MEVSVMQKLFLLLIGLALLNSPPLLADNDTEADQPATVKSTTKAQKVFNDDC